MIRRAALPRAASHHVAMDLPGTRALLHLVLHALVPLAVAFAWPGRRPARTYLLLLAGWLIDVDHLLADPVYAPAAAASVSIRCTRQGRSPPTRRCSARGARAWWPRGC